MGSQWDISKWNERDAATSVVLRGARVVTADAEPRVQDIVIRGDVIAAVTEAGEATGDRVVDVSGLDALPGAIDLHVHFREPGQTHKETLEQASEAAAVGGTTLVCDMPSTLPNVVTAELYEQKLQHWRGRSAVDYVLWAGGTDPRELEGMARLGAPGVKIYMATAPGFEDLFAPSLADVTRVLETSKRLGWVSTIHVADQGATDMLRADAVARGARSPRDVIEVNRSAQNLDALGAVIDRAIEMGVRLNIAHLSAYGPRALEVFRARARGNAHITAETCYPALSEERDLLEQGMRVVPTVVADADRERWIEAIESGVVASVATDHAPHTREEKARGESDAWASPPGYPAVQTSYPLGYDAMLRGELSPRALARAWSASPSRVLNLPTRGAIEAGRFADIVLADPELSWTVKAEDIRSKVGWSPFENRTLRGRFAATFLHGALVVYGGELVSGGQGRPIAEVDMQRADGVP